VMERISIAVRILIHVQIRIEIVTINLIQTASKRIVCLLVLECVIRLFSGILSSDRYAWPG